MLTACSSSPTVTPVGSTGGFSSTHTKVSQGVAARDATGDVKIGKWTQDATLGIVSAPVTITNHSHKRSMYIIEVALESANHKVQYDTGNVLVDALEAGQSTVQTVDFVSAPTRLPRTAVIVPKTIERTSV
jgi:hypothetical protein